MKSAGNESFERAQIRSGTSAYSQSHLACVTDVVERLLRTGSGDAVEPGRRLMFATPCSSEFKIFEMPGAASGHGGVYA